METAIVAAIVAGTFSLLGVVVLVLVNLRLSRREIQSSEAIALRNLYSRQDSEIRGELASLRLQLQRCEDERANDAAQRRADAARHQTDEEQRRLDDERHKTDEARHAIDTEEIVTARRDLSAVQRDLADLRRSLHSIATAAKVFGDDITASDDEIEENASHP